MTQMTASGPNPTSTDVEQSGRYGGHAGHEARSPFPNHLSDVPCPLPRRIERVRVSIASPLMQPSPNGRRVGIRIVTFEACSGFTHVTARRIAQPPKAAFVTRLQPCRLPGRAARQLPDQSTTLWVESSSTSDPRLRGALPIADIRLLAVLLTNKQIVEPAKMLRRTTINQRIDRPNNNRTHASSRMITGVDRCAHLKKVRP